MFLRVRRLLAVAAVCGLSAAIIPAASQATAYGIQYWGAFTANIHGQSIGIPSGQLAHWISGKGYYVSWDGANFASAANLCDPSMRFTYGNGSYYLNGSVHWGCSHVGQWKYTLDWKAPRGSACAELWEHDWRILVARQCHYIY